MLVDDSSYPSAFIFLKNVWLGAKIQSSLFFLHLTRVPFARHCKIDGQLNTSQQRKLFDPTGSAPDLDRVHFVREPESVVLFLFSFKRKIPVLACVFLFPNSFQLCVLYKHERKQRMSRDLGVGIGGAQPVVMDIVRHPPFSLSLSFCSLSLMFSSFLNNLLVFYV
jgi:hypothetical protein